EAISFFLVAAGAQSLKEPKARFQAQNFLCHTSQKQMEHERLSGLVRDYLAQVAASLSGDTITGAAGLHLQRAHERLRETLDDSPSLDDIAKALKTRIPRREVIVVNSSGSNAEFGRNMNFIIGGNILGRGLTIENLLVTYYLRRAKVSQ